MSFLDNLLGFLSTKTIKPISNAIGSFIPNQDYSYLNDQLNYLDQYTQWTYKAIKTKADSLVKFVPRLAYGYGDQKKYVDRKKDNLIDMLYKFNKFSSLSEGRRLTRIHQDLTGTAYWLITMNSYKDYEFFIIDPMRVSIISDQYGLPKKYRYDTVDGESVELDTDQLIVFREPNPQNWQMGYGTLQASRYEHNSYELASKYNMNMFGNSGRPDGFLAVDGIDDTQTKRLQKMIDSKYKGVKNARRLGIINFIPEFIEISKAQKELDFVASMQMLRDNILSYHGVPKPLVGLTDSTFTNSKEAQRVFQLYTLEPILEIEATTLTEQLVPLFYEDTFNYYFEPQDPNEIDEKLQAEIATMLKREKVITQNEAREMVGKEAVEGGDEFEEAVDLQEQNNDEIEKYLKDKKITKKKYTKGVDLTKDMAREMKKAMYLQKTLQKETNFSSAMKDAFENQAKRVIEKIVSNTGKGAFNTKEERIHIEKDLKPTYIDIATEVNNESNIEIKSQLLMYNKSLYETFEAKKMSGDEQLELMKRLGYFADEVNDVTKGKLFEAFSIAINENLGVDDTKRLVRDIFNGFIDGEGNIQVLKGFNVYEEAVSVTNDGNVVIGSANRYNKMLENITNNLKGEDAKSAMMALRGVIDKADPIGQQVDELLSTLYSIPKEKGITYARVENIARTEVGAIKGLVNRNKYDNNDVVEGSEWLSAGDGHHVRDSHAKADGQVVKKGESFIVGGEKLDYPCDSKGSAENVCNCRCDVLPVVKKLQI